MTNLNVLLAFINFTHKFQQIKRAALVRHEERRENDFEHSFQLALVAWYLVTSTKLNLNVDKVIQYALAHDLIEVYSGDTPLFLATDREKATQQEREHKAVKQLREALPEASNIHAMIEGYEKQIDPESKFVYALDKLLPMLNNYLDNGRNWKKFHVTLASLIEKKADKVSVSADIKAYYDDLLPVLKQQEDDLFPNVT